MVGATPMTLRTSTFAYENSPSAARPRYPGFSGKTGSSIRVREEHGGAGHDTKLNDRRRKQHGQDQGLGQSFQPIQWK